VRTPAAILADGGRFLFGGMMGSTQVTSVVTASGAADRDSAHVLEKGLKCETEAILGPSICDGAFLADVLHHLTVRLPASLGL